MELIGELGAIPHIRSDSSANARPGDKTDPKSIPSTAGCITKTDE